MNVGMSAIDRIEKLKMTWQLCFRYFYELIIVFTWHINIDVIIPRYESIVKNCAN